MQRVAICEDCHSFFNIILPNTMKKTLPEYSTLKHCTNIFCLSGESDIGRKLKFFTYGNNTQGSC